jgi:hypothetical protein
MNQLRPLIKNERVAHREDYDWECGGGIVTAVDGSGFIAYVLWDNLPGVEGPFDREELVAMDDPDLKHAEDTDV